MPEMSWFRFYSESLSDLKFARIARTTGMLRAAVFGVWAEFLCLASESPIRGALYITQLEPYTLDDLAEICGMDTNSLQKLIDALEAMEMLTIENGAYYILNWHKRQYSSDNSTERVQKHRMKRSCNVSETPPETETETDTESDSIENTPRYVVFAETPSNDDEMQVAAEMLTGCRAVGSDIQTLDLWLRSGIIADDIRGALAWRKQQELPPVKTIAQLERGVLTERKKRIQSQNARGATDKPRDYTAMLPPVADVTYQPPPELSESERIYLAILDAADIAHMQPQLVGPLNDAEPELSGNVLRILSERADYLRSRAGATLARAAGGVMPGLTLEWSAAGWRQP